ncbi:MAG: glutamate-1-semialdehyde 2,1-aminomutase [Anaerolineales bacterium]
MIQLSKSKAMQERAKRYLPLGVNSNFRYWGDEITPYMDRAQGCYLWDVDGNQYIDYRLGFGPIILGHSYPEVDDFVRAEITRGTMAAMTTELEIEVAEMIVEMCPAVEMVRFACSGTEATMHAIRVARAYTGRDKILKFEGMYHGFHDYTLWSTYSPPEVYGNRNSPIPIAASSGIPRLVGDLVLTVPFNDFDVFDKIMRSYGDQIAAVIVEPCMGNCGAIEPLAGFLNFIRQRCDEVGCLMILDEVKTGFRIANGGAQEVYGIQPDLATYAKALANGYPLAAFGGKREIMSIIGQGVGQGGTFNNNKCGVAAAYATLRALKNKPILKEIEKRGERLKQGLKEIFDSQGIVACVNGYGAMFSFALGVEQLTDQRSFNQSDQEYYLRLVEAAMERGVMPDHDPREPWFLSYSHTDEVIDRTLEVMEAAIKTTR